ncbi:MAG: alpha/beta fold hydrolase [Notoacmeibacter sp.]|nr:alpha/beta fold hydrolase [Notoacmeibacter sp.]MCC0031950.1 alpha/beta fold hydrolase [Brucellaceae bacterium]
MVWDTTQAVTIRVAGAQLNGRCFGPSPAEAPTIVMLHEGLGSVELWRGFPQALQEATGFGVFAYDRRGYGRSSSFPAPWALDYMKDEAVDVLPHVLDAIGFRRGILLGHSDGASIATLYLGNVSDHRVRGLVLIAPHFFTEPEGLASIAEARKAYDQGDLRARLARYHDHVDDAFNGWNMGWLTPDFRGWNIEYAIDELRVPVLGIQGLADQYGTMAQMRSLETRTYSPCEILAVEGAQHAPHAEKPEIVMPAIQSFVGLLERMDTEASPFQPL